MRMRPLRSIALLLVALSQLSCAVGGLTPATHSQTAERMGLAPEYRIFYDALQGEGDWVYIQPAGYVFRPNVNFLVWRPYEDGFWAPSDVYGWTWISAEPFGWATYHYGTWLYDRYFGWVWTPGRDWGPAWVAWQVTNDHAAWSPLLDPGAADDQIPGGGWTYAPMSLLGSTSLAGHLAHGADLRGLAQEARPVQNLEERGGVTFNRGPSFELVEKASGSLRRVRIDGLEPGRGGGAARPVGAKWGDKAPTPAVIESTRNAAEDAARAARAMVTSGGPPPASLPMVRPVLPPPAAEGKPGAATKSGKPPTGGRGRGFGKGAASDTTAR